MRLIELGDQEQSFEDRRKLRDTASNVINRLLRFFNETCWKSCQAEVLPDRQKCCKAEVLQSRSAVKQKCCLPRQAAQAMKTLPLNQGGPLTIPLQDSGMESKRPLCYLCRAVPYTTWRLALDNVEQDVGRHAWYIASNIYSPSKKY